MHTSVYVKKAVHQLIKLIEEVGSRVSIHTEVYYGLFEPLSLEILGLTGVVDCVVDCGGSNAKNMSPPSWIAFCNPLTTFAVIKFISFSLAGGECTLISYITTLHALSCAFIQTRIQT